MARTKTKVEDSSIATVMDDIAESDATIEASPVTSTTTTKQATTKEYEAEDLIRCRSITQGKLMMPGPRSKIYYVWYNVGDVIEVEYQDLTALLLSRSKYLLNPCFVIEDEELLKQSRWQNVAKVYESLYGTEDINKILNLPPAQLKKTLTKLPKTFWRTLTIEVATRIENGSYDSINRIKIFDEVCGTDLMCLIN